MTEVDISTPGKSEAEQVQELSLQGSEIETVSPEPDMPKVKMLRPNSLKSRWGLEKYSVIRELWRAHLGMIEYYTSERGGSLSIEDAMRLAAKEDRTADKEIERIAEWNVDSITWYSLDSLFRKDPRRGQELWEEVKDQALQDFKSGHFAAQLFERTEWQKDVWKRAHFVAVYQAMFDDWKPRGAIEHSMVEMLAISFFLYHHWIGEHMLRATTEPRRESGDYQKWREREKEVWCRYNKERRPIQGQWIGGAWEMPYQSDAEAIAFAAEMADRFRREYQAQLRQMRDWRRYNVPVTINNPQQVNIAAEGGQQVNVQSKGRGSQNGTGKKRRGRKALAGPSGERVNLGKARKVKARA